VLELFGKRLSNLIFLVGDNARVNTHLADLLNVPFIGCASHRFNLACQRYLEPFDVQLKKIRSLMVKLRTIKQAGKLRKKTSLEPVLPNETRWSSTHGMLKRFFEIRGFIDDTDPDLAPFLPAGTDLLGLQKLMDDLSKFQCITKELQKPTITLSDVRVLFDAAFAKFPSTAYYLDKSAQIVHSAEFENAVVKVIDESFDVLSMAEKDKIAIFTHQTTCDRVVDDHEELSFVQKAYKQKKRKLIDSNYQKLDYIPPTSTSWNDCLARHDLC
jgi:hypothetical protein